MVDNSFYNNKGPFSLSELANIIGCIPWDKNKLIYDLAVVEEAKSNDLFYNRKYKNLYKSSKAGVLLSVKVLFPKTTKINLFLKSFLWRKWHPHSIRFRLSKFFFSKTDKKLDKTIRVLNILHTQKCFNW